jgi:hypothetical protein
MFEICSNLSKTGIKMYYFCQYSIKAKKLPNFQNISILASIFKKGQMATLQKQLCPLSRMLSPGGWESIFMIAVESKTNREMGKKFALKKVSLYFEQNFKKNLNFSNPYHTILMSYLLWLNVLWCNAVIIRRVRLNSIF